MLDLLWEGLQPGHTVCHLISVSSHSEWRVVHDDSSGLWGFMSFQRQYLITLEKSVYFPFPFPRYKSKWPQFVPGKLWKKFLEYPMAELYSMLEHWSEGSRSRNRKEVMYFPGIIWGRFVPPHFFFFLCILSSILVDYLLISFLTVPKSISHSHKSLWHHSALVAGLLW